MDESDVERLESRIKALEEEVEKGKEKDENFNDLFQRFAYPL